MEEEQVQYQIEVLSETEFRVTIQVNFWSKTQRVSFERAECWDAVGGRDLKYGACVFSILADVDRIETPEPFMSTAVVGVALIGLAFLARRKRRYVAPLL